MSPTALTSAPFRDLLPAWDALGGAGPAQKLLAFRMQAQTAGNWCWAATATSVSLFYAAASPWTQCTVAGAELNQATCCQQPTPRPCDLAWYLDRALTRTSNYSTMCDSPVSFAEIRAEIDAGRPVGARIGWHGGGGHFVAIHGYAFDGSGTEYLDVDDPIYGQWHHPEAEFRTNYLGAGSWTHTYFTRA